jgi:hypothetical protein
MGGWGGLGWASLDPNSDPPVESCGAVVALTLVVTGGNSFLLILWEPCKENRWERETTVPLFIPHSDSLSLFVHVAQRVPDPSKSYDHAEFERWERILVRHGKPLVCPRIGDGPKPGPRALEIVAALV